MNPIRIILFIILCGSLYQSCHLKENEFCEPVTFTELFHQIPGTHSHFELSEAIECAKSKNRPILFCFTGHTTSSVRGTELLSGQKNILDQINKEFTFLTLYCDDRTKAPSDKWIVNLSGDTLKTIGKINLHLQTSLFNRIGQPYFVVTDTTLKKTTSTFMGYPYETSEFQKFLKNGLMSIKK